MKYISKCNADIYLFNISLDMASPVTEWILLRVCEKYISEVCVRCV